MRLLPYFLVLSLALGKELVIPAVQKNIANQLDRFKAYTSYKGPTGAAASASNSSKASNSTGKIHVVSPENAPGVVAKPVAVTTPYWYETITHQGKAPFQSNATYPVYRNVMLYGAKGCVVQPLLLLHLLMGNQRRYDRRYCSHPKGYQ